MSKQKLTPQDQIKMSHDMNPDFFIHRLDNIFTKLDTNNESIKTIGIKVDQMYKWLSHDEEIDEPGLMKKYKYLEKRVKSLEIDRMMVRVGVPILIAVVLWMWKTLKENPQLINK